jgi:hypothetical protein
MMLDQIDRSLSEWQARLSLASANLLELDDLAAYQRLRGGPARAPLTGLTQARVAPALAAIDGLWPALQQLTDTIKQAERLRRSCGRLWTHDAERRQIEFLLEGASIPLPSLEAPFAQRGLLSVAEQAQAITPEQLLARMTQDFAVAKDAVLALDAAWDRLDALLASADREAATLQTLSDELGVGGQPDLEAARRRIAALHGRVDSDPLGVDASFASDLEPLLERVRAQLDSVKRQRDRLEADLRRAWARLESLRELQRSCQTTARERQDKIEAVAVPAALPDPIAQADLTAWLERLEAARRQGQWTPLRVGLDRWLQAAAAAQKQLSDFQDSDRALLERREELRGLVGALQAKARAQAARGVALDPALAGLAREAETLLHGRPTPLERAAALVTEYERRLPHG